MSSRNRTYVLVVWRIALVPVSDAHIPVSASLLWSQRNNPAWLPASTFVARFQRSEADPSVWESTDGHWTAELRRAPHGAHLYLAVWRDGVLLGTYDGRRGWHDAGPSPRRRPRPSMARQLACAS
jgi:hypothetical protein